jgi:hypothetical protein
MLRSGFAFARACGARKEHLLIAHPALILGADDAASAEIVPGHCQSSSCAGLLFR